MPKKIDVVQEPLHAKITLPGSKSITHRALLLAALADGTSEILGISTHPDTLAFIKALQQIGIVIQLDQKASSCIIAGCNGKLPKKQASIWCKNLKSALYFLLAACAGSSGIYYFDGTKKLRQTNIKYFLNKLSQHGAQYIPNDALHLPLTLVGADSLHGGENMLDASLSSYALSALLMIAPYTRHSLACELSSPQSIDMTCMMMTEFGVLTHRLPQGQFKVPVPQRYRACDYRIEPDFSLATYFFAATALLGGEITIPYIKRTLAKQPEVKILSLLEKMGCQVIETETGLTLLSAGKLLGIEVNLTRFSHVFAALIALAPFAISPSKISHLKPMSTKEIERMTAFKTELSKMNIHIESGENWLKIFPSQPRATLINTHQDPRIAMAFTIMGLKTPGMMIDETKYISKKYPDFFPLLDRLTLVTEESV